MRKSIMLCTLLTSAITVFSIVAGLKFAIDSQHPIRTKGTLDGSATSLANLIAAHHGALLKEALVIARDVAVAEAADNFGEQQLTPLLRAKKLGLGNRHIMVTDFQGDLLQSTLGESKESPIDSALRDKLRAISIRTMKNGMVNTFLSLQRQPYLLAAVPMRHSDMIAGVVLVAEPLDDGLALEASALDGNGYAFLFGGRVVGTTISDSETIEDFGKSPEAASSRLKEIKVGSAAFDAASLDLPKGDMDVPMRVILLQKVENTIQLPGDAIGKAAGLGVAATFLSLMLIALPLSRKLRKSSEALAQDFNKLAAAKSLGGKLTVPRVNELSKIASAANLCLKSFFEQWAALEKEHKTTLSRVQRITEILSVESSSFDIFLAKTTMLKATIFSSLQRVKATGEVAKAAGKNAEALQSTRSDLSAMLRAVYTVRNYAEIFGLNYVSYSARQLEERITELKKSASLLTAEDLDHLSKLFEDLQKEVVAYKDLRDSTIGVNSPQEKDRQNFRLQIQWLKSISARLIGVIKSGMISSEVEPVLAEFYESAATVGLEDLRSLVLRFDRVLKTTARGLGKDVEPIAFSGNKRFLDRAATASLSDVIMHGVRNAASHGIESPEFRTKHGKPRKGQVTISSNLYADTVEFEISDDGKGVDLDKVRVKAAEKQVLGNSKLEGWSADATMEALFESGMTTSNMVTKTSGSGVGLDAVRATIAELGGGTKAMSAKDKGFTLQLWFPDRQERFRTRHSIVDIVSEFCKCAEGKSDMMQRAGMTFSLFACGADRMLVHSDAMSLAMAWHQILDGLLVACRDKCSIRVKVSRDAQPEDMMLSPPVTVSIYVVDQAGKPHFDMVDRFKGARGSVEVATSLAEAGAFIEIEPEKAVLQIAISANLNVESLPRLLRTLVLCGDESPNPRVVGKHFEKWLRGWKHEEFQIGGLSQFLEHPNELSVDICFVDEKYLQEHSESLLALQAMKGLNVVVIAEAVADAVPELVFMLSEDPLLIQGHLDDIVIKHAFDSALLRFAHDKTDRCSTLNFASDEPTLQKEAA